MAPEEFTAVERADAGRDVAAERLALVRDHIAAVLTDHDTEPALREVVDRGLEAAGHSAATRPLAAVEIPLDVCESVTGTWEPAVSVAAATLLVYLGADLLDDLADREARERWSDLPPGELLTAAAAMVGSLSYLALAGRGLGASATDVSELRKRLAVALWEVAGGQVADLQPRGPRTSASFALAAADRKSGGQIALAAGLGARVATDDAFLCACFETYGRAYGLALQISSDVHDIWLRRPSPDLLNGRLTAPIAFALESSDASSRTALEALLDRAQRDATSHDEVAVELGRLGAAHFAALKVETAIAEGTRSLEGAAHRGANPERLRDRLRALSMLGRSPRG